MSFWTAKAVCMNGAVCDADCVADWLAPWLSVCVAVCVADGADVCVAICDAVGVAGVERDGLGVADDDTTEQVKPA